MLHPMGQYRVNLRDADGQLFQMHVIDAERDADAGQFVVDCEVEVWHQTRIVALLKQNPSDMP
jgi:hypothetical protein